MLYDLDRFREAQKASYTQALTEIKNGRKQSHWMWFIFPQLAGLGHSDTSRYYGIRNKAEAEAYLKDSVLGRRLIEICEVLMQLNGRSAHEIFGYPDDVKLRSSMTLFSETENSDPVFQAVLDKYFRGTKDPKTIDLLDVE